MQMHRKIVVPYSGGIDSTYLIGLALRMGYDVHPVIKHDPDNNYVPAAVATLELLGLKTNQYSISPQVNSRDRIADGKKGYIPGVNMVEALNALAKAEYLGYNAVWMGFAASNLGLYPDQSPEVFNRLEALYNDVYQPAQYISIELPILKMTREDVVRDCYKPGDAYKFPGSPDYSKMAQIPLHKTLSCMRLTGIPMNCGKCERCWERQKAFAACEVIDKTEYFHGNRHLYEAPNGSLEAALNRMAMKRQ